METGERIKVTQWETSVTPVVGKTAVSEGHSFLQAGGEGDPAMRSEAGSSRGPRSACTLSEQVEVSSRGKDDE